MSNASHSTSQSVNTSIECPTLPVIWLSTTIGPAAREVERQPTLQPIGSNRTLKRGSLYPGLYEIVPEPNVDVPCQLPIRGNLYHAHLKVDIHAPYCYMACLHELQSIHTSKMIEGGKVEYRTYFELYLTINLLIDAK